MSIWDRLFPYRFNRNQIEKEQNTKTIQTNATQPLSQDFWRRGNFKALQNINLDKSQDESDLLSGYLFAALDLRKTIFAEFCEENIITKTYNDRSPIDYHPYLKLIEESKTTTEFDFWTDVATDWDIRGEVYLFLLRRVVYKKEKDKNGDYIIEHLGKPVSIECLPAKDVKALYKNNKVVGYEQWMDDSHKRVFAPEQIIHIMNKNPFDRTKPYSIFDIAKDYQYTMNKSTDFTTSAIVNNTNTPGIVSTDKVLNDQEYDNLIARINGHESGKVIISDGSGQLTYTPIAQELDKSALPDITDVTRQTIFAITGTSKTMLGIEESGTTRDTAKVQSEKFVQRVIKPLAKRVVSALNFDYRVSYPEIYKNDPVDLTIKGTVDVDEANELYKTQKYLYDSVTEMTYAGYTAETSEEFLKGNCSFVDLEREEKLDPLNDVPDNLYNKPDEPTDDGGDDTPPANNPPEDNPAEAPEGEEETEESASTLKQKPLTIEQIESQKKRIKDLEEAYESIERAEASAIEHNHHHDESIEHWMDNKLLKRHIENGVMTDFGQLQSSKLKGIYKNLLKDIRKTQRDAFKNAKVTKNAVKISDVRTEKQEQDTVNSLYNIFKKAMFQIIPIISAERKDEDKEDLKLTGNVNVLGDKGIRQEIDHLAMKCAKSHADTIYNTILFNLQKVDKKKKNSLKNLTDEEISTAVKSAFLRTTNQRASVVAEDIFMRAVNNGRYYTDYLLLELNGKLTIAYKTLDNDYDNPCPLCAYMIDQPMRPFIEDFVQWKQDIAVKGSDGKLINYNNNFAPIKAGDLHPGCRCMYSIVLKETNKTT